MIEQEKHIGESQLKDKPIKPLAFKLKDKAVTTNKIDNEAVTESKMDPALLAGLRAIDDVPTENSNNPVKSSGIYNALINKQDTISDLDTIRSNAEKGLISIQNIRNLMDACNEVFSIGYIGYHIEMSMEPDEHGDYTFEVVMNE